MGRDSFFEDSEKTVERSEFTVEECSDGEMSSFLDDEKLEQDVQPFTPRWMQSSMQSSMHALSYSKSLLPGFLTKHAYTSQRELTPTSYLVAIRGYAALIVVLRHFQGPGQLWILDQPFFNVMLAGFAMVDIFFVISGFVLSYGLVKLMRAQKADQLLRSLSGSCFRRWSRLYLPTGMAMLFSMLAVWSGVFNTGLERYPNFFVQLWDLAKDFIHFSDPFHNIQGWWTGGVFRAKYLWPLWTIPVEFRGSLAIFLTCAGTCMLSTTARIAVVCLLIICSWVWQAVYIGLFLGGMVLAELSLMRQEKQQRIKLELQYRPLSSTTPNAEDKRSLPQSSWLKIASSGVLIIIAWFLFGSPQYIHDKSPTPWQYLGKAIPSWWIQGTEGGGYQFWLGISAIMFIYALDSCPVLQTPFRWNFSQYLGEISFGVYALHPLALAGVYNERLFYVWRHYFYSSAWGMFLVALPVYFVTFWMADYFTRLDRVIVNFGYSVQKKYFIQWSGNA